MSMNKRSIVIENRSLEIIDNLLPFTEHLRVYDYALRSNYSISRAANFLPENNGIQNTLCCHLKPEEIKEHGFIYIPEIYRYITENKLRIRSYYFNLGTASDVYAYHVDDYQEGCKTLLCYLNTKWDTNWEGETHFADRNLREILASVSFIPGRVAIFDSLIPHKSSQPSFKAEHYRVVLAIKLAPPGTSMYETLIDIEQL